MLILGFRMRRPRRAGSSYLAARASALELAVRRERIAGRALMNTAARPIQMRAARRFSMSETPTEQLPRWNLASIFPGLESPEFERGIAELKAHIDALDATMQAQGLRRGAAKLRSSKAVAARVEVFLGAMNANAMAFETLKTYIFGFVSTDSFNTLARRRLSELELLGVQLETQQTRFTGWLGEALPAPGALERLIETSAPSRAHAFFLKETLAQSRYLMSEVEEDLAAELLVTAGNAWEKLQNTVTSQVAVPFAEAGEPQEMPVAALQNLVRYHPDEGVRRGGGAGGLRAWGSGREPPGGGRYGVK